MQLSTQNGVSLFNFSQTKISLAPQITKNVDVTKILNGPYLAKSRFFVTILSFAKCIMCTVLPRNGQNQWYFYAISDVTRYFGSLFWIKSCAICEGLNVLEGPQNGLLFYHRLVHKKVMRFVKDWTFWVTKNLSFLHNFDTDFDFVLKVSRFKIPQMYIYDFCMFTPILVRLRRHTLCECNLV